MTKLPTRSVVPNEKKRNLNVGERATLKALIASTMDDRGTINLSEIQRQFFLQQARTITRKSIVIFAQRTARAEQTNFVLSSQSIKERTKAAIAEAKQLLSAQSRIVLGSLAIKHGLNDATLTYALTKAGVLEPQAPDPQTLTGRILACLTGPQAHQLLRLGQKELSAAVQDALQLNAFSQSMLTRALRRLPNDLKRLRVSNMQERQSKRFSGVLEGITVPLKDTTFFRSNRAIVQKVLDRLTKGTEARTPIQTGDEFIGAVIAVADRLSLAPENTDGRTRLFLKDMYASSGVIATMMKEAMPHLTELNAQDQAAFAAAVDRVEIYLSKRPEHPNTDTTGMIKECEALAETMEVDDHLFEARVSRISTMLRNIARLSNGSTDDEIRYVFFELAPSLRVQALHAGNTGMVLIETLQALAAHVDDEALSSYTKGWDSLIQNLGAVSQGLHCGSGSASTRAQASGFLVTLRATRNAEPQPFADHQVPLQCTA